jgi:ABC-type amino acid transport system permease subunit
MSRRHRYGTYRYGFKSVAPSTVVGRLIQLAFALFHIVPFIVVVFSLVFGHPWIGSTSGKLWVTYYGYSLAALWIGGFLFLLFSSALSSNR